MKNYVLITILLLILSGHGYGQKKDTPPGAGHSSLDSALQTAIDQHKTVMLYFSGSDWCKPCIRLSREIIDTEVFHRYADKHLVMMHLDFPKMKKNKLPLQVRERNEALADRYNRNGVFPLLIFLDAKRNVLGTLSYLEVAPEVFIQKIDNLLQR